MLGFRLLLGKKALLRPLCSKVTEIGERDFKTVYSFPYIMHSSVISRLKLYQTALSGFTVPIASCLSYFDQISPDLAYFVATVSIGGLVPLYGLGILTNKLIGIVYYNRKANLVKIAYLDYWGRRKDEIIEIKDVIPFAEIDHSFTDVAWLKFRQFSNNDTKKICTKYGIIDFDGFNKIFTVK